MKTHKTSDQILAELATLREQLPRLPKHQHETVNAEITVLAEGLDLDDVYAIFGDESADEFNQELLDAAISAQMWMTGESRDPAPSAGWEELL